MKQIQDDGPGTLYGKRYRFLGIVKALWTGDGLRLGDDSEARTALDVYHPTFNLVGIFESGDGTAEISVRDPSQDWRLRTQSDGDFEIADQTGGTIPATVENGAPANSLYVTSGGLVGFGVVPSNALHLSRAGVVIQVLQSSDNSAVQLRLKSNSSSGRRIVGINSSDAVQSQIIFGDSGNFQLVGPTTGDLRLAVDSTGAAIGLTSPSTKLHIQENNASTLPQQEVEQLGSGDAGHQVTIPTRSYAYGVDATDSKWKICTSSTPGAAVLGTNTVFAISSAGVIDSLKSDTITKASGTPYDAFPSGTKLVFYQASPPSGWTQDTANADACLRVVSGSGGGTGGSLGISSASVSGHVLTISELPAHSHPPFGTDVGIEHLTASSGGAVALAAGSQQWNARASTGFTGADASHTHGLALKYIDVIVASKN